MWTHPPAVAGRLNKSGMSVGLVLSIHQPSCPTLYLILAGIVHRYFKSTYSIRTIQLISHRPIAKIILGMTSFVSNMVTIPSTSFSGYCCQVRMF